LFHLFILVFNINYYPVPVYLHHFGEDVTYCRRSVCNGIRTCFYGFQYAFGGGTSGCDNGEVGMSFPDLPYYSRSIGSFMLSIFMSVSSPYFTAMANICPGLLVCM
jgi:hypothetical protein